MMEAPTLSRFLLRSRVLWLTILCLLFFSWAWWDSQWFRSDCNFLLGNSIELGFGIGDEVFWFDVGEKNPLHPGTVLMLHRESTTPVGNLMKKVLYAEPTIRFSTLLLLTLLLCTLWHAWRWHVIRKHAQQDHLTNK